MSFLIYFDESNKLDSPNKQYSYYGAYGGNLDTMFEITKNIKDIYKNLKTKSEMHFNTYDSGEYIKKYFQVLNHVINQEIAMNILIINNQDAAKSARKMDLSIPDLRDLFYTKIPERLFYGLIRNLNVDETQDIRIKVDDATEYRTLDVYDNIKKQMNAHSAYRNKDYKVSSILGKKSDYSIPLQIMDTFMGIIVFLMEEQYYDSSISSQSRSDLIYRFLIEGNNIEKFKNQITLFKWEGNEEKMIKIPISDYISTFLTYKTQYDLQEMIKLQSAVSKPTDEEKELSYGEKIKMYHRILGYSNRQRNTLLGYLSELDNGDRNYYLRPYANITSMETKVKIEENVSRVYQLKGLTDEKYRYGFKLGKVIKNNISNEEILSGRIDYQYLINQQKVKDSSFTANMIPTDYWKSRPETICGEIKIYLDEKEVFHTVVKSKENKKIEINLKNATNLRIVATGTMIGIVNPKILKDTY
ncbi:DUF3800 domain-containing protein [Cytobacillus horneckiae]|uniref:DUF3800 domain-containing protein n=1 Tax=Cytobacillus horneckiae TaxID=549687 RepID=UPI00082411E1|nr:DUF3800 domain-containing protein [Cytobacillus horneckiae]MEC1158677.1 DUF3800 domain-containing protein [Cytobacillus horneckiae]NRG44037.1 DUF3800 domain-containing protein [Bacillus sp. CRN 9]